MKGHCDSVLRGLFSSLMCGLLASVLTGAEGHAAVTLGESDDGWAPEFEVVAQGEQAMDHGLPPQGGVRAALGQRAGRRGSSLLRELARRPEVAAPEALGDVRRNDRPAVGRHRGLRSAGEQGRRGICQGLHNTIRIIQRRSDGLRDEEYLHLKVLTCLLDPI